MTPLAESVAIILGASEWPEYPSFEAHQAFQNSAEYFRDYLLRNGLRAPNLLWRFNDKSQPGTIITDIAKFLRDQADESVRNVVFYYVGHGGYRDREYFLALPCTSQTTVELTTLAVRHIAKTLNENASDKRQIIIMDACYAAGAVKDFIYQGDDILEEVHQQIRESLPASDAERGTSLFCAAGPKIKAKAPWEKEYTMFSGALRRVLSVGDPKSGKFLSLEKLAELVEKDIHETFRRDAVRPELHTPRQEKGDIRTLLLFPNPASQREPDSPQLRALSAELEETRREVGSLTRELEWERESRTAGWYEMLELRMEIDQFGDMTQCQRTLGIHGPEKGEIGTLPYVIRAVPELGTCVLDQIMDEQRSWLQEGTELASPGTDLTGELVLSPPATANTVHRGFTISSRLINSYAMTTLDAKLRNHPALEYTSIGARFPARHLRLVVFFPHGYAPTDTPWIVAYQPTDASLPLDKWPENPAETARVAHGLFYDKGKECAVLNVERASPVFRYVLRWRLSPPPDSQFTEAIRAREQVRGLLGLGPRDLERLDSYLGSIRDVVCRKYLGWRRNRSRTVNLSLFVFDETRAVARVVCATFTDDASRKVVEFPWGAGVVGWVMRRRRPALVDVMDREAAGIYRHVPGWRDERYVLCVPLPLPSDADRRTELLHDPSIPCAVASLSCVDESGNMERLKGSERPENPSSATLMGNVSSELAEKILDVITRQSL
jgi:Caspase domain